MGNELFLEVKASSDWRDDRQQRGILKSEQILLFALIALALPLNSCSSTARKLGILKSHLSNSLRNINLKGGIVNQTVRWTMRSDYYTVEPYLQMTA